MSFAAADRVVAGGVLLGGLPFVHSAAVWIGVVRLSSSGNAPSPMSLAMNKKLSVVLIAVAVVGVLAAVAMAWRGRLAVQAVERRLAHTLLDPALALIEQNQSLLAQTQVDAMPANKATPDALDAYLARIRADGVPAHAAQRQRLDQIAGNQVAALALLTAYAPHARTPLLPRQVDLFREHSTAWQGRWHSVMQVFMGGGHFTVAPVAFPSDLPARLRDELAAFR